MYIQTNPYHTKRIYSAKEVTHQLSKPDDWNAHREQVLHELKLAGTSRFGMLTMEANYLPNIIHQDEQVGGIVYGLHEDGIAMLIATDRRVIFLDKKPLFINEDEVNYHVVSGVSYSRVGWGTTVTLHSRIKDYTIHTLNRRCAEIFVDFIERRCLERDAIGKES